jgi:hypothetical protein
MFVLAAAGKNSKNAACNNVQHALTPYRTKLALAGRKLPAIYAFYDPLYFVILYI